MFLKEIKDGIYFGSKSKKINSLCFANDKDLRNSFISLIGQ